MNISWEFSEIVVLKLAFLRWIELRVSIGLKKLYALENLYLFNLSYLDYVKKIWN